MDEWMNYSFKIIPSLKASLSLLTSVDVKVISIVHVFRDLYS